MKFKKESIPNYYAKHPDLQCELNPNFGGNDRLLLMNWPKGTDFTPLLQGLNK